MASLGESPHYQPLSLAMARAVAQQLIREGGLETITFEMLKDLRQQHGAEGAFYVLGITDEEGPATIASD